MRFAVFVTAAWALQVVPRIEEEEVVHVSPLALTFRAAYLGLVFLPVTSSAWLAVLIPIFRQQVWYSLLRMSVGRAGAAFVKWAQWSATRADLFPDRLRRKLALLQADAPAHGFRHTRRVVLEATGEPVDQYFESFDRKPVASGSIAQVHRAVLRGRRVAVKVRHPGVARVLALDSTLMVLLSTIVDLFLPWLRLAESVRQFSATLAGQARLDVEAGELERFRRRFRGWHDVSFPEPLFATPALLIETFENGKLVNSIRDAPPALGAYLVNRGEDVYLKMLLVDRVMHADLHPGNMLYAHGPRLALVDAGMVATLTPDETEAFVGLIEALGAPDAAAAARCVRLFSKSNDQMTQAQVHAFDADVAALFVDRCGGYGTHVDFGHVVRGVLELVRKHKVRVDANYATLIINALCLDGLAHDFYPTYSVLDGAKPLLQIHRRLVSTRGRCRNPRPTGRFLFRRLCLPVAWRLKHLHDRSLLRRLT